jgi:hypothetical protein
MNDHDFDHLDERQIVMSVVDEASLTAEAAEHLRSCAHCLAARRALERKLSSFGDLARQMAPSPRRPVAVELPQKEKHPGWFHGGRPLRVAAAGMAVVAVLILGTLITRHSQEQLMAQLTREILEDERLMSEIARLEEDALPDIVPGDRNGYGREEDSDEEFMDFLVPASDDESLTGRSRTEVTSC